MSRYNSKLSKDHAFYNDYYTKHEDTMSSEEKFEISKRITEIENQMSGFYSTYTTYPSSFGTASLDDPNYYLYDIDRKAKNLGHAPPSRSYREDLRKEREYPKNGKNEFRQALSSRSERIWHKWCAFWKRSGSSRNDSNGDSKS